MNNARPRRRFLRYSLRGLLLGIVVVAIGLAIFTGDIRRALRQASDMKTLRENGVDIRFAEPTDSQKFLLRFLPREGVLEPVECVGRKVVDEQTINILGEYSRWQVVVLRTGSVSDAPLRDAISRWKNLRRLFLGGQFGSEAIPDLANLAELTDLTLISNCDSEVIPAIASARGLKELELFSSIGDQHLADLLAMPALRQLELQGNLGITSAPFAKAASDSLEYFDVSDSQFGDAGLRTVLKWPSLELLGARNTQITDSVFHEIAADDAKMTRIRDLNLSGTKISSAAIPGISKLKTLERLWLSGTSVTDQHLERLNDLPAIKGLLLEGCGITDDGLAKLALPKLHWIHLARTEVTYEGLVEMLPRLPAIQYVDVIQCQNITARQFTALQQRFPAVEFVSQ